jgi:hypothetical protein
MSFNKISRTRNLLRVAHESVGKIKLDPEIYGSLLVQLIAVNDSLKEAEEQMEVIQFPPAKGLLLDRMTTKPKAENGAKSHAREKLHILYTYILICLDTYLLICLYSISVLTLGKSCRSRQRHRAACLNQTGPHPRPSA